MKNQKSNFANVCSSDQIFVSTSIVSVMTWACLALNLSVGNAQESKVQVLPQVEVFAKDIDYKKTPGSAFVIESNVIEESRVFNVNEALRKVPGVHVREEEGVGLRPNIGIRGMNPTRSTKVLLLEDGLPLSYAPYGDNASYYHPPIDRYDSIEVSKGSQVIRFGPQTAGGVINYITPMPQKEFGGIAGFSMGTRGYMNSHLMMTGNGLIADIYRKESDGARENMHSKLDDLNFKFARQLNDDHKLVLRATHFREYSQLTYSGLTEAEYTKLGARYNPFKNDYFDANRTGISATHEWKLNADRKILTSVYGAYFERDWWRQASTTTGSLSCANGAAGTPRISGVALTNADLNACRYEGRLRNYTTTGIDSRIFQNYQSFGMENQIEYGVKYQNEVQRRRREDFATYNIFLNSGASSLEENLRRTTNAFTVFVSNKTQINEKISVTPILRIENINHQQHNAISNKFAKASFTEFVPGVGLSYQIDSNNLLYGGVHKGFSPPRVEDAIDGSTVVDLNAERSINAEIGLRSTLVKDVFFDVAVFRNDFKNLVQVGSIAGGTTKYQEGKALIQGLEVASQIDKLFKSVEGNVFVRTAYTYIPIADQKSAFSNSIGAGSVGKRLPYSPENTLTLTLGYRAPSNWNGRIEYVYVGKQFTDFANTATPASNADGQSGEMAAYGVVNTVLNYTIGKTTMFVAAKNITDATYIVDRTRGIQVGMPRTIQAGLKYAF
jgi:Fe(3+) dicitrate transport protein